MYLKIHHIHYDTIRYASTSIRQPLLSMTTMYMTTVSVYKYAIVTYRHKHTHNHRQT